MNKKQLEIITKEYAEHCLKFLNSEIKKLIESDIVKSEIDFKKAYELRKIIAKVALENIISDRIVLNINSKQ
ncbi:hypothetical protein [Campylobacter lanienae]|uniref:hypothetical protein n=1 Tax=Campylobacter lanienae TaxID=75658 RepID=UPI000BB4234F|nr:hypothetical protein [Campylobacter lanienae]MDD6879098.1 hypothetical protein [bacterium]